MSRWYLLRGHEVVPSTEADAVIREKAIGTPVAQTDLNGSHISTVFLSLDHAHFGGPPQVFETLVINGPLDGEMDRYSTWDEAVAGHAVMVERVKSGVQ